MPNLSEFAIGKVKWNQTLISSLLSAGTSNTGVKYKGHVEIPNLSDENDVSEVEVSTAMGDAFIKS